MKHTLLTLLFSVAAAAQTLPTLKPSDTRGYYAYTTDEGVEWAEKLHRYLSGDSEIIEQEEEEHMFGTDGPLTESPGDCSWYCGGGPYKITTSSFERTADSLYVQENLHDFNILTSWMPESDKSVGAKMNFHFGPHSPRVHTIVVYNGDMKNVNQWQKYARAKKLKLYINGNPVAFLALEDEASGQAFKIDPVQSETEEDMVLTLEVLEVYPGSKYTDLAIAEVNFDGLDVHCFAAGTMISMKDGSDKAIETIRPGEEVLCTNSPRLILTTAKVARVVTARHTLKKLTFKGITILVTDDHSFMTEKKEWASLNPEKSNSNYKQDSPVTQLEIGDKVWWAPEQEWVLLTSISGTDAPQTSYTLELEDGSNFIANGLLVKTEKLHTDK